ncbi:hypothetical protein LZ31DRAFT_601238 [Colletotrichum somersetense]|nr:hypothetical protein LZ31DRAFT_601238 [Colletotrichum somersetense]
MGKLTILLDKVVWRNLGPFMLQSLGHVVFLWGGIAALTLTTLIGGMPLLLGVPLLEAPAAACMFIKYACDLISILERSFRNGRKFLTKEKIEYVASIYMKDKVVIEGEDGAKEQKLRRSAVHGAVNDLFPRPSLIAIKKHSQKTVAKSRQGVRRMIEMYVPIPEEGPGRCVIRQPEGCIMETHC